MTITGYSDRINHALAFAAKHHDQQVRKGTRLPYLTHPANVAIILTRYGRDEATVVAGILHEMNTPLGALSSSTQTLERGLRRLRALILPGTRPGPQQAEITSTLAPSELT